MSNPYQGINISTDRLSVEAAVVQLIRDWATANPHELVAIDNKCKLIRDGLLYRKAMTRDKRFLHKAEIPTSLYSAMQTRFNRNWSRDRWLLNLFLKHFRVGCINMTSEVKP